MQLRPSAKGLLAALALFAMAGALAAEAKGGTLTCVGLYSETDAGYVSYRLPAKAWVVVKVGDVIPAAAEVRVNVDRDWVEFIRTGAPAAVYEIDGPESGETIKKVADILKEKPRAVVFPKGSAKAPDAKFKDKLVVVQYLGRQIYFNADGDSSDIRYGSTLDAKGTVSIIGINNTLKLMNANEAVTTIIGPLKFGVEKVLTNQSLYKFLNVQK